MDGPQLLSNLRIKKKWLKIRGKKYPKSYQLLSKALKTDQPKLTQSQVNMSLGYTMMAQKHPENLV